MPLRPFIILSLESDVNAMDAPEPTAGSPVTWPTGFLMAQIHQPTRIQSASARTSFYIDCDKYDTLVKRIFALVMCPFAKSSWKHRTVMERIPDDDNCHSIFYALKRDTRKWYKCCVRDKNIVDLIKRILGGSNWYCQEVHPTAWFVPKDTLNNYMPFAQEAPVECFSQRGPCADKRGCFCTHGKHQCIQIGEPGGDAKWAFGKEIMPDPQVWWFESRAPALALGPPACVVEATRARHRRLQSRRRLIELGMDFLRPAALELS
mmetsp:Transcript_60533/g.112376  ORF Transcript_60533/g.112376 Transcript_60533/m.112376 type:complete len:263 (+) Transcript_60533:60-848(+)